MLSYDLIDLSLPPISVLPPEMLITILRYLDGASLLNAAHINKYFFNICSNDIDLKNKIQDWLSLKENFSKMVSAATVKYFPASSGLINPKEAERHGHTKIFSIINLKDWNVTIGANTLETCNKSSSKCPKCQKLKVSRIKNTKHTDENHSVIIRKCWSCKNRFY